MGEAIITSRSAAQEEAIPVVPGYHSILATVRDYQGKLLKDYPINCKDGSVWYNYKTNETGKVLFTCNSGAANISINNVIDGYRYLDFPNHIINCDCPIGGQTRLAFNIPKSTTTNFSFAKNSKIRFLHDQECSGVIIGGGGGGSSCGYSDSYGYQSNRGGSGGGGGFVTYINNYLFNSNMNYNINIGSGGRGGTTKANYYETASGDKGYTINHNGCNQPGNAGGTSYISNTNLSANGGKGGQNRLVAPSTRSDGGGYGGAFNESGGSSGCNDGGGGGGGEPQLWFNKTSYNSSPSWKLGSFGTSGGYPYGGNGLRANYINKFDSNSWRWYETFANIVQAEDGKGPGGGGGAADSCPLYTSSAEKYLIRQTSGGNGAAGICKLNMVNY